MNSFNLDIVNCNNATYEYVITGCGIEIDPFSTTYLWSALACKPIKIEHWNFACKDSYIQYIRSLKLSSLDNLHVQWKPLSCAGLLDKYSLKADPSDIYFYFISPSSVNCILLKFFSSKFAKIIKSIAFLLKEIGKIFIPKWMFEVFGVQDFSDIVCIADVSKFVNIMDVIHDDGLVQKKSLKIIKGLNKWWKN